MREIITLPGIGGSGEAHWQSRWEARKPRMRRFSPSSWDLPDLDDWIEALDREVQKSATPPLLVAHSLSCLLVPHWSARTERVVAGALLVAPPDPSSPAFPAEASGFADPPIQALPFPSMIIASSNDPYSSLSYARSLADQWGSAFIDIGAHGHLNGSSGLGDWSQGRAALAAFEAGLG
jgi:predicted alpha/beta hydrolase family esterase